MTIYRLDCEWDLGISRYYSTREKAMDAATVTMNDNQIYMRIPKAIKIGLVHITEVYVR